LQGADREGRLRRIAWGELALVTALAALALAYLIDARSVSLSVNNLCSSSRRRSSSSCCGR